MQQVEQAKAQQKAARRQPRRMGTKGEAF